MLADLRSAWRALRRSPGYLAAAVLTLALGIGATTALFGVVDRVLLRPLPYREPERLVRVWDRAMADGLYDRLRTGARSYRALAGVTYPSDVSVLVSGPSGPPSPARVEAASATGNLFATVGVSAALGRTFRAEDDRPGAPPVAVLGDAFWRERFGADPRAVGRTVDVDGVRHEIVGVMPPDFRLPTANVALWTPARIDPANQGVYWWRWRLQLVGRLAPGVTPAQAEAETRALVVRAGQREFPQRMDADFGRDLRVVPLQEAVVGGARTTLYLLFGAVVVVLVVAVVNAMGLALVRAAGRERELTVRAAVGAERRRLVRQLVAEGVVVAAAAGALGTALAWALTRGLVAALPRTGTGSIVPRAEEIGLDGRALAFALLVALVAGVLAALVPALGAARVDLRGALSGSARGTTAGLARRRALERLVVAQVALGVVLAAGAGLLATSLARLRDIDPGFRAERVTVAEVPLPAAAKDSAARARVFYDALLARVRALPGVEQAALTSALPLNGVGATGVMDVEAHPRAEGGPWKTVAYTAASPGAPRVLGIPLLAGRDLTDADRAGAPLVALVDAAAVRAYWPEFTDVARVVGQRVRHPNPRAPWITIVGVVGSVRRDSLAAAPDPSIYVPLAQDFPTDVQVVTRGPAGAAQLAPALRRVLAELEPTVPLGPVRTLASLVDESVARPRFVAQVLVAFAAAAVVLGAVGVYGVIAFAVARRTRELGVRTALGATPATVRRMVLGDGGRLAAAGIVLGLAGAVAAGRAARGWLYGVAPAEPVVLVSVALLLGGVTLLASLLPALRAARVSPLVAMRDE